MKTVKVVFVNAEGDRREYLVKSNNIPMGIAKARIELARFCHTNGIDTGAYRVIESSFVNSAGDRRTVQEIHSRIMSGRSVSGSEINRWARSPKGMMTVAMMNAGRA